MGKMINPAGVRDRAVPEQALGCAMGKKINPAGARDRAVPEQAPSWELPADMVDGFIFCVLYSFSQGNCTAPHMSSRAAGAYVGC